MKLQTQIPIPVENYNHIDYNSKLLLLGSCFVENIGNKLAYFKFKNTINPFGILFHPKSIEALITNAINEKVYTETDIFFQNEQWHCFDAHSKLSKPSKKDLLNRLNTQIKFTNQQINKSTHIIITLGTAWIYRFIETDSCVANCHKIPQKKFLKEITSIEEIRQSLQAMVSLIKNVNPKACILFTVSPVRHIKDGFVQNTQSKAHLIAAIHQVIAPENFVHYFPSYEIMLDELRDYRFYAEDMLHPNATAVNYIWAKFKATWMTSKTHLIMDEVELIQKGLAHVPFNSKSDLHQSFLDNLELKKNDLQSKFSISFL